MASLSKIALILAVLSLSTGQLIRINLSGLNISIIDIFILIAAAFHIINALFSRSKIKNPWFLFFIIFAWTQLIVISAFTSFNFVPFLHLFRLTALLCFLIIPPKTDPSIEKFLKISLWSTLVIGLIQYIFWPNLTYFNSQNWDPHLNRISAPFLDPTFTALIYLFLIIFSYPNLILTSINYLGLALSYSRSTWISLFVVSAIASYQHKKPSIFILTAIVIILTIIFLPKPYGEGTNLARTSTIKAKIENYQIAFKNISQNPILGVGFNRLPLTRTDQPRYSHAASAFDNPLLTIWATTGLLGLFLFTTGLLSNLKSQTWTLNLFWYATIIHSLFANSLLYPPILFILVVLSSLPKYRK